MKENKKLLITLGVLLLIVSFLFITEDSKSETQETLLNNIEDNINYEITRESINFQELSNQELLELYFLTIAPTKNDLKVVSNENNLIAIADKINAEDVESYFREVYNRTITHEDIQITLLDNSNQEFTRTIYSFNKTKHVYEVESVNSPSDDLYLSSSIYGMTNDLLPKLVYTEIYNYEEKNNEYIITLLNIYESSLGKLTTYSKVDNIEEALILNNNIEDNTVGEFLQEHPEYTSLSKDEEKTVYKDILNYYESNIDKDLKNFYKHQFVFEKNNGEYTFKEYKIIK